MKEKIKLVIVFITGIMISVVISVYAATVIGAGEVSYTPGKVSASNVQDAIDGVYTSANTIASTLNNIGKFKDGLNSTTSIPSGSSIVYGSVTIPAGAISINCASTSWTTSFSGLELVAIGGLIVRGNAGNGGGLSVCEIYDNSSGTSDVTRNCSAYQASGQPRTLSTRSCRTVRIK